MKMIKEVWADLRNQPLIGTVTVIGTALSIFLIMIVAMTSEVGVMSVAPESNRDRMLHHRYLCVNSIGNENNTSSGSIAEPAATALFMNLETAEAATIYSDAWPQNIGLPNELSLHEPLCQTDDSYWKVFNFTFISGGPYTETSPRNSIVIDESLARELFNATDVAGREVMIDRYEPYTVVGVVENVPIIASTCFSRAWMPIKEENNESSLADVFGDFHVTILARDRKDFPKIREEIARRESAYNIKLAVQDLKLDLNDGPYDQETVQYVQWSNMPPDAETPRRQRLMIYAILLLVPAVNLSSMTHSRLRRKVSEMGVRRAFGCTRRRLVVDIISQNLLITLIGGALGLLLSLIFGWIMADSLFVSPLMNAGACASNVTLWMLIDWNIIFMALGFCFLLNLLSSGIPAWRASRTNVVEAIGGARK